jgi:hypothetical protein
MCAFLAENISYVKYIPAHTAGAEAMVAMPKIAAAA